ncbi:CAF17-like 4Fe-4S cluster assembly/insertion protein YgfZ [Oryzibacter oryziterrae]|uniref:CAF17-like 4Fe-4S cluster assembly/insertion protein YgfZ n=1 Tax=Oryzibacter oryziterrae TaxID=2766474 RepID=UPI001F3823A0|nr:folate-binding protein [Oryzibacter oryziterrae]
MAISLARLTSRVILSVTGPEAEDYLQRMITQKTDVATAESAGYGALLTPQGKVISDFLFVRVDGGFLLDAPVGAAGDLLKRLTMFRLRAQVELADVSEAMAVHVLLDGAGPTGPGTLARDPRHPELGQRFYASTTAVPSDADGEAAYHARRVVLGVPELGFDVVAGDCFPHDLAMDDLSGVSFTKGCFVGQEVVSRMKHRGTARRRPVRLVGTAPLSRGSDVLAAGRSLGSVGTVAGREGLAILRLDKIKAAIDAGGSVTVGDVPVHVELPAWAHYGWPEAAAGDE